jgi:hypothetical protein
MKKNKIEFFFAFGYLLEFIIKIWRFSKKFFQHMANLGHLKKLKILCIGQNLVTFQPPKKTLIHITFPILIVVGSHWP